MATRWCPTCRSEWWTGTDVCRDCGAELVDEQPPDPDETGDHGLAALDLSELDDAGRWRLTLVLKTEGIAHRWSEGQLELPAAAVELLEEELAGISTPDEDDVERAPRPLAARLRRTAPTGPPRAARCVAFLLDAVVFAIVGSPLGLVFITYERNPDGSFTRASGSTWGAVGFLVVVLLYATATVATFGKTPGMALAGVEVRAESGRLGWGRAFLRAVLTVGWIGALPLVTTFSLDARAWALETSLGQLWAVLLLISILNDPDGRGLHDRLVGSVVRRSQRSWVEDHAVSG